MSGYPEAVPQITEATIASGFDMASDPECGAFLRTLAATKPAGHFLELGTGTGLSAAWLLDGMTSDSTLLSIDDDETILSIARNHLAIDQRVDFILGDAGELIDTLKKESFDFIFADTWAGKFEKLEQTLSLLKAGGIYFVDDLLPQPNWPEGHEIKVQKLKNHLSSHSEFHATWLESSTGLMILVKK